MSGVQSQAKAQCARLQIIQKCDTFIFSARPCHDNSDGILVQNARAWRERIKSRIAAQIMVEKKVMVITLVEIILKQASHVTNPSRSTIVHDTTQRG